MIAAHLDQLFPGSKVVASYPFHLLRDSDVEPDEDDEDHANILEMMRETLAQRPFGTVVRLDIDRTMPGAVRDWLLDQVHASPNDVYVLDGRPVYRQPVRAGQARSARISRIRHWSVSPLFRPERACRSVSAPRAGYLRAFLRDTMSCCTFHTNRSIPSWTSCRAAASDRT